MSEPVLVTRRAILAGLNLSLGGLALGIFPRPGRGEPTGSTPRPAAPDREQATGGLAPNVLVHIAEDGTTTIVCHRSEMGQGVRSSIPVLIADELGASLDRVVVVQADGHPKYGDQNTDGSTSIRQFYGELRQAGAAARTMLVAAAARRWRVRPATCTARDHQVVHQRSGRALPFGELVAAAARQPVPDKSKLELRPASELEQVARADLPVLDGPAIVTGTAVYGADVKLPGLLVAVVARPPQVGARVARYDAKAALAIPGVRRVVEMPPAKKPYVFQPWGGLAVVADDTWSALRGRAALDIEWTDGDHPGYDSQAFRDELLASVRQPGDRVRTLGDADAALSGAAKVVDAEYLVPHLAHMTMEPLVATARVEGGRAEIWAPTQSPQTARSVVAELLGVKEDAVTVHVTLLGGGFGRKSKADFPAEAAFIAREVGAPVRVQWTRDDDLRHGYYNAVSAQKLRAALADDGAITAWHHRTAFTPIAATFRAGADTPSAGELQQGVLDLALAVPNVAAEACRAPAQTRVGWYRSVYNIFHAFAIGSFVDELAHARGADPRDTWLELIGPARTLDLAALGIAKLGNYGESLERHPVDAGRLRRVIERVTAAARWDQRKRDGRALGLAAHRSFVSYTAVVLSVVPDRRHRVRVDEAWIAMDPGTVVNIDRVRAQLEGSVVMGISNALFGGITMKAGAVEQETFRDARIARIGDAPRAIHVDIAASGGPPGGVGEPGVPPVGAALANAIFALEGLRLREIPLARGLGV